MRHTDSKEERIYTIKVDTDHPLADQAIANGAQAIAEELGHDGTHSFNVSVLDDKGKEITGWQSSE